MKKALTWKEKIRCFFGLRYVANHHSKEIHDLKNKQCNCSLQYLSSRNAEYVTVKRANQLFEVFKFDFCHWCVKSFNPDQPMGIRALARIQSFFKRISSAR